MTCDTFVLIVEELTCFKFLLLKLTKLYNVLILSVKIFTVVVENLIDVYNSKSLQMLFSFYNFIRVFQV